MPPSSTSELPSAPLADYFWIAGVDGTEILDVFQKLGNEYRANNAATATGAAFTDTIEEDADAEEEQDSHADGTKRESVVGNQRASCQRLSRLSSNNNNNNQRLSFRSGDSDPNSSHSNRSSLTVKLAQSPRGSSLMDDFDFDRALLKFASEREHFLTDLSLTAGAITSPRPRSRLRTQKIIHEEPASQSTNLLRSGIGSVRRHMAFRDMNSMKRQPSLARQGKEMNLSFLPLQCLFPYVLAAVLLIPSVLQHRFELHGV